MHRESSNGERREGDKDMKGVAERKKSIIFPVTHDG
jgi:hypothetical protein